MVKIYSTSWCPACVSAKRLLEDKNIQFDIVSRSKIDSKTSGPLIILESTAITYVDVNYDVSKDANNNLLIVNRDMS